MLCVSGFSRTGLLSIEELAAACNEIVPAALNCPDSGFQPGDIDAFDIIPSNGGGLAQANVHLVVSVTPSHDRTVERSLERRATDIENVLEEIFSKTTFDVRIREESSGFHASVKRKAGREKLYDTSVTMSIDAAAIRAAEAVLTVQRQNRKRFA